MLIQAEMKIRTQPLKTRKINFGFGVIDFDDFSMWELGIRFLNDD